MRRVTVFKEASGEQVATDVEVANSMWSRFWGLMFRGGLRDDSAMLIDPCSSIHTIFMRFPIDAVFLDKSDVIKKIAPCVKPYRATMGGGGKKVLEMPCGAAERAGLEVGDRLRYEESA
jgi:uncharacterized membrane protein (UPF0127 family)